MVVWFENRLRSAKTDRRISAYSAKDRRKQRRCRQGSLQAVVDELNALMGYGACLNTKGEEEVAWERRSSPNRTFRNGSPKGRSTAGEHVPQGARWGRRTESSEKKVARRDRLRRWGRKTPCCFAPLRAALRISSGPHAGKEMTGRDLPQSIEE